MSVTVSKYAEDHEPRKWIRRIGSCYRISVLQPPARCRLCGSKNLHLVVPGVGGSPLWEIAFKQINLDQHDRICCPDCDLFDTDVVTAYKHQGPLADVLKAKGIDMTGEETRNRRRRHEGDET